jgi:hypothetical protein
MIAKNLLNYIIIAKMIVNGNKEIPADRPNSTFVTQQGLGNRSNWLKKP